MMTLDRINSRPFGLVAGQLNTKDQVGFFAAFAKAAPFVICVPVRSSEAGVPPKTLAQEAMRAGLTAQSAETPLEGVRMAFDHLGKGARVLICGSLYLAGDVLAE
jgi:dihydrofolate synthase / folylpolyglutamate synthase